MSRNRRVKNIENKRRKQQKFQTIFVWRSENIQKNIHERVRLRTVQFEPFFCYEFERTLRAQANLFSVFRFPRSQWLLLFSLSLSLSLSVALSLRSVAIAIDSQRWRRQLSSETRFTGFDIVFLRDEQQQQQQQQLKVRPTRIENTVAMALRHFQPPCSQWVSISENIQRKYVLSKSLAKVVA